MKDPEPLRQQAGSFVVAVVDDDESLRQSVSSLFRSVGLSVETYSSAEAFASGAQLESLACLVLDLRLPGMSGLELTTQLRAAGSRLPIVILSAISDEDTQRRSQQAGVSAFLAKPFAAEELLSAVRRGAR
ncbi:response regulator transcription factor [Polyangium sorediatum]|uniref:Response regulator n=1 Tax=Polyangium sorediatum TaxID=889274 RepID=A0ABT6NWK5_9BACT|nr:response regulator [Polyangium sorediatum]MDI1432512.1 response regulator [Polyangium sorediatum]